MLEILGSDFHKSKEKKFEYLFKKYDFRSGECVFVIDILGDILEENKVSIKTITVDFGFHGRDRLERGNPFRIVSSFCEITGVVDKLGR